MTSPDQNFYNPNFDYSYLNETTLRLDSEIENPNVEELLEFIQEHHDFDPIYEQLNSFEDLEFEDLGVEFERRGKEELKEIREVFEKGEKGGMWDALLFLCTVNEFYYVVKLAQVLNYDHWEQIVVDFFHALLYFFSTREDYVMEYIVSVPDDWFMEPYYYTYVQYFGTEAMETYGDFYTMTDMLDYLESIGIFNIYVLPHYQSPGGDSGYDISSFTPHDDPYTGYGGEKAYNHFMKEAMKRGFRVVTDGVFNHTSIEHEWFVKARKGEEKYQNYYIMADDWEVIKEEDRGGDLWVTYKNGQDQEMERILIFPDVSRSHLLQFEIEVENQPKKTKKAYHSFYPFQVDLNLQNPDVIREILFILGSELNGGVMGKRTDAIAHWLKPPGRRFGEGNPETYAIQGMFKVFLKLLNPKSIIIPEAVKTSGVAATYLGDIININGIETTTQGDAMFNFEEQGALRESLFFQSSSAFWEYWGNSLHIDIPENSTWLSLLGHHDEMYLGFIREKNREFFRQYIVSHGGQVYKNGMSAGGRTASCLNRNSKRIGMAIVLLYSTPGVPCIYYGDDIEWINNEGHARRQQGKQYSIFQKLGLNIDYHQCYDPRDLHRGSVPKDAFMADMDMTSPSNYVKSVIKHMNFIYKYPVFKSTYLHPVTCYEDGVICMEKYLDDHETGKTCPPILVIINLTNDWKLLTLPIHEFNPVLHNFVNDGRSINFLQLITGSMKNNLSLKSFPYENNLLNIGMGAFQFLILAHPDIDEQTWKLRQKSN